jgi:serine/threonine-protein kinase
MSPRDGPHPTLPPELAARLEPVCARFEADWQAGLRPSLEEVLAQVAPADRPPLLRELLSLDLKYRTRGGERPTPAEYHLRLREHSAVVDQAFALLTTGQDRPDSPVPTPTPVAVRAGLTDSGTGAEAAAAEATEATPGWCAGRYEVREKIAGGGMGWVWLARDPELNRPLAIKVLRDESHGDPELERRFREEAQITGQLQHPGIPPVHDVGVLPDGRPFFAMKLIKGRTLAELLRERQSPGDDLSRFVAVFEQVCQTLAYAHSKRVIHRDLKPSNVMVGAFGEVQVMDWGLAKLLRPPEDGTEEDHADASAIATARPNAAGLSSQVGAVLGTPAYMAPEQARGEVDSLDERSDVFGLGGLLCIILTGDPPLRGPSGEARRRGALGDLSDALTRVEGCGFDPELVQLARACLAAEKEARPRDAGVVAQAIGAYLAGVQQRLREAERQRAVAEARAIEERKRRRLAVALAAAVLLLMLVGGSAAWLFQQQQARALARELQQQRAAALARQREAGQKVQLILDRARGLLAKGWQANDLATLKDAKAEAERAAEIALSGDAPEDVRQEATAFRNEAVQRIARTEKNRALLDALLDIATPRETRAYLSDERGRLAARAQPSVDAQYAAAFRRWGLDFDSTGEVEIAARLREEPQPVLLAILAGLDSWMVERRQRGGPSASWECLRQVASRLDQSETRRELRALLAGESPPRDLVVVGLIRATLPWTRLRELDRGNHWRRLLELRSQVNPATEPVLSVILLARACSRMGDPAGAEELLRRAVAARPNNVALFDALGRLLEHQRPPRLAEAIECYRAARALRPRLGVALAMALLHAGRTAEGEAVLSALVRQQPHNPELHCHYGIALSERRELQKAVAALTKAIVLSPDYPEARDALGRALHDQELPEAAEAQYRQAIRLKANYPEAYVNLGRALDDQERLEAAEAAYRHAIHLKPNYPEAYVNLGLALRAQDKMDQAVAAYVQALQLRPDFPEALFNLGFAQQRKGEAGAAVAAYQTALRLKPHFPEAHYQLGVALRQLQQLPEAAAAFKEVLRLCPNDIHALNELNEVLGTQGNFQEALTALRTLHGLSRERPGRSSRSLRQGERDGFSAESQAASMNTAGRIRQMERLIELNRQLPTYLAGKRQPSGPREYLELAVLCQHPGKRLYAASARFFARAFALNPTLAEDLFAGNRYNAARSAVLAGTLPATGQRGLHEKERARLRRQALTWLHADLAACSKQLAKAQQEVLATVLSLLTHLGKDPDLARVRHLAALKRLPNDEQAAWQRFWSSVTTLRKRAEGLQRSRRDGLKGP